MVIEEEKEVKALVEENTGPLIEAGVLRSQFDVIIEELTDLLVYDKINMDQAKLVIKKLVEDPKFQKKFFKNPSKQILKLV